MVPDRPPLEIASSVNNVFMMLLPAPSAVARPVFSWPGRRPARNHHRLAATQQENHDDDEDQHADRAAADVERVGKKRREYEVHDDLSFVPDGKSFAIAFWMNLTRSGNAGTMG